MYASNFDIFIFISVYGDGVPDGLIFLSIVTIISLKALVKVTCLPRFFEGERPTTWELDIPRP